MIAGEEGHWTSVEEGGEGPIIKICNNNKRSLGPEWSMSEIGAPPLHNLDNTHGLVASNNNKTIVKYFINTIQSIVVYIIKSINN